MTNATAAQTKEMIILKVLMVLLSCAVPIQIMGRSALACTLILAFFCFFFLPQNIIYLKRALNAAWCPTGLMVLITALFWIPNIFYSIDPVRSLEAGSRTFVFICFATLFWAILVENKFLHGFFCRSIFLASGIAIIFALIAEIAVPGLYWFAHFKGWQYVPLGTSLKSFSALAVFMIPALLYVGLRLRGGWGVLALACSIGFIVLVGLTYNRAVIAGFVAIIVIFSGLVSWSSCSRIIRVVLPIGAIAIFIGVMVWLNMTRQRPDFVGDWYLPLWLVDYQRQIIWRFALELAEKNLLFGMGMNTINFAPGADVIIPKTLHNLKMIPSHPHNWILEIAAETGVFGLLSLLFAITISLIHMILKFFKDADICYLVSICISTGYWVSGLFNFSFWSAWWQVSFMIITALCLSLKADKSIKNS